MKLGQLIFGVLLMMNFSSFAQDEDTERECKRMRFLAGEALKIKDYKEASMYYIKGETICGGYDAKNYARLIGSIRKAGRAETDKANKKAYNDTLDAVYNRAEAAGMYNNADDLYRAYNNLQSSNPTPKKADSLFLSGIKVKGTEVRETYIVYYYFNLYSLWNSAKGEEKAAYKARMIKGYFRLSKLISDAKMSVKTQESITGYFNIVVKTCDDILPELNNFMSTLPQDAELKKVSVNNFIALLEDKECTQSDEYFMLIDTLIYNDPSSIDALMMKAKAESAKGKHSASIVTLKKARDLTTDDAQKNEIKYMIASEQYVSGAYKSAYSTAMTVSGDLKGKALVIAGKSVGQNANNCGDTTFDRKCNYIYAVQLLQQAKSKGAATGGKISEYTQRFPTSDDCFAKGNPSSVTLECYGVTVSPCN